MASSHDAPPPIEILMREKRRFLAFLSTRVATREDAEDILQSAYAKRLEKGEDVDKEHVVAWFFRILRNALIDHYRHRDAGQRAVLAKTAATEELSPDLARDLDRVVCECVTELLPTMAKSEAELLHSVDLSGRDVTAVARELGISPGAARVRLFRARKNLRRSVERVCRTCSEHGCLDCTCAKKS